MRISAMYLCLMVKDERVAPKPTGTKLISDDRFVLSLMVTFKLSSTNHARFKFHEEPSSENQKEMLNLSVEIDLVTTR